MMKKNFKVRESTCMRRLFVPAPSSASGLLAGILTVAVMGDTVMFRLMMELLAVSRVC